jgi:hypothetical protein
VCSPPSPNDFLGEFAEKSLCGLPFFKKKGVGQFFLGAPSFLLGFEMGRGLDLGPFQALSTKSRLPGFTIIFF